jgi:co-chaperonin GroES (HSP10)
MPVHPKRDYIKLEMLDMSPDEFTTAGGIVIPGTTQRRLRVGRIAELGPDYALAAMHGGEYDSKAGMSKIEDMISYHIGQLLVIGDYSGLDVQEGANMFCFIKPIEVIGIKD